MSEGVTFMWPTMAVAVLITGPWLFALVDAVSRPLADWARHGHHKLLWLAAIVLFPVVGAAGYLIVVRPKLRAV